MLQCVSLWLIILVGGVTIEAAQVTYEARSLLIDGEKKLLFSGSIHYPRSTPEMWPSLISKAKEGGLDVIQTYVFWNLHELQPGKYDFSGRYNLVKFIKEIQAQGLYACLRIGPFIESEWNYGGFPFWLHDVPGIVYRSDNEPFKYYMQNFTTKIVDLMKSEGLYASQGGPIILSQIENEYQNVEAAFHEKGPPYVTWAAKMAVDLQTGVPWIMCKQTDAPDPVINTCNGMRCGETFGGPNAPNKPAMWTENWTSFIQVYGTEPYIRSAEDIAFHVTLFIAKMNGSYINYYMYHGGTNFGRTGSAYTITSYYDQAPLDEYGLKKQPKWGHLRDLHEAIKNCSATLLNGSQSNVSLGANQTGYVFEDENGGCVGFLINNKSTSEVVAFRNATFELLPKSISILQNCNTTIFNTAKVNSEYNERTITPSELLNGRWKMFEDAVPTISESSFRSNTLLEHTNVTKDSSDYLWYCTSFEANSSCSEPVLHVKSLAHVANIFVNGNYTGSAHGSKNSGPFEVEVPITVEDGANNISVLSVMVGLPDSGAFLERRYAGPILVEIRCAEQISYNLTNYEWGYQVGLSGEKLKVYKGKHVHNKFSWKKVVDSRNKPLTWFKSEFDLPVGNDPVALNLSTMGKGEAWINGRSIGRYWISFLTTKNQPSQTLYHVPRSFLKPSRNILVIFEESTGDPFSISLVTVSRKTSGGNNNSSHYTTYYTV